LPKHQASVPRLCPENLPLVALVRPACTRSRLPVVIGLEYEPSVEASSNSGRRRQLLARSSAVVPGCMAHLDEQIGL